MAFRSDLYRIDPETGDILTSAKRTLGDYLSRRTSKATDGGEATGGPDDYTYNPPRANPFPVGSEASVGQALPIDAGVNNQPVFARDQEDLERWSKSGDFDTDKFVLNDLDPQDRHRLLKQVETSGNSRNDLTTEMQRQVGVNLSRNRFASNKAFATGENPNPTVEKLPVGRVPVSTNPQSLYSEMANQAIASLIIATGETPKSNARRTTTDDVISPSAVQGNFGTLSGDGLKKLDTLDLHPEDVANYSRLSFDPSSAEVLRGVSTDNADDGGEVGKYTRFSAGNLNSYLEPFGTALPTSMIAAAGVLLVCSVVITLVTAAVLSFIARAIPKEDGILPLGSERGDPFGKGLDFTSMDSYTDFFSKTLGLIHPYRNGNSRPDSPYVGAALSGVAAFVGVNTSRINDRATRENPRSGLDLTGLITNAFGASGYYVVMARNIIRSLTFLGDSLPSLSPTVGGVEALIAFILRVKESKVVRFTDTMARLGVVQQMTFAREQQNKMTRPSAERDNPVTRVAQSRAIEGKRALSYSHTFASNRGSHLLPKSFRYASIAYNNGVKNIAKLSGRTDQVSKDVYLTPEEVGRIEDQLEAEYVPFYLQDLRTNEILNFHAFLETLEDSYSPSYTAVEGYGRMDPVQIYKGTTRSVSLSFMVVATNENDFERLWLTINKLVMMIYPQWTGGEELTGVNADGKTFTFVQPFSQTIGSAPIVRLRVGELIHSNYSRFGLARVFGLGGVSTTTGKRHFTSEGEEDVSSQIEYLAIPRDLSGNLSPIGKIETAGETAQTLTSRFIGTRVKVSVGNYGAGTALDEVKGSSGALYSANVSESLPKFDATIVEFLEMPGAGGVPSLFTIVTLSSPIPASATADDGTTSSVNVSFLSVPVDSVTPDEEFYSKIYDATPPGGGEKKRQQAENVKLSTLSALSENFGNSKSLISSNGSNSIVRSFEAAGGRGLAGAITNLGFTWYDDNTTWEIKQGSRAPMACKVTISFAPIHDIPMGLDSEGFPRAVPYPVGGLVRSTFFPELNNNDTEKVAPIISQHEERAKKR